MNLFRRTAPRTDYEEVTCWAHRVLDAVRAGLEVDDDCIEQALRITGDL